MCSCYKAFFLLIFGIVIIFGMRELGQINKLNSFDFFVCLWKKTPHLLKNVGEVILSLDPKSD